MDEKIHINNSEYIVKNKYFINEPKKYLDFPAPTTPLANIFFSLFIFISKDIVFLRLVNILISILCIVIFSKILNELKIKDDFKILSFFTFPYFIMLSQIVMTDIFALLMALISVYYFVKYEKDLKKYNLLLSSLFFCLSFFSRQYYIFVGLSHLFYLFIKNKKDILFYSIFLIPIIIYIFFQKGLTPIEFRNSYNINFFPIKFFIISSIGFYFFPQIMKIKININYLIILIFLILLVFLKIIEISCVGISCRLINNIVFGIIFSFLGILLIFDFTKNKIKKITFSFYLIFFVIEQFFNSMPYDRYFLSIYWVLIIFSDKKLSKIQFLYFLILSTVYIFYKLFFI
ncbi:MAG: glycosyltransferase family 39 protein [Candidatus Woesearchaeota archaeon]|nr:glycosyltransferase family 39 protein [Candidatus Aenigmarchaeota archaeon]